MMTEEKALTGYPSIDKPWLKYYSEEAINATLPEKTLYQYIYDNNKEYQNNNAINYFGKKITYGKMFENIEKAAKAFKAIGIKEGDIVTIMSMQTPETIYCIYALNRIGAVANMIYMTLSEKEIVETLKKTESKAMVVLSVALEKVNRIQTEIGVKNIIVVSPADSMKYLMRFGYNLKIKSSKLNNNYISYKEFIKKGNNESQIIDALYDKSRTAVIVYTSGSTGEPKGVMLSNYNLNAVAHQYKVSGMKYERGDTFFNMIPPFYGFGISIGMNLAFTLGLEEILWIMLDSEKVAEGFAKYRPNHFISGPAFLDGIMNYKKKKRYDMSNLVTFAGGGESISIEKENEVNDFLSGHGANIKYLTGYGMTELGATVCTGMNHIYKQGTLGVQLPAVAIKIVEVETKKELKFNEIGEICFEAPNTMLGYYKNDNATKEIIKVHQDGKRWLHTGDLGMIDEDGFVHFKGRIKRISLTRDKDGVVNRIFPDRVEQLFEECSKIKDCGTIVIPDEERVNILVSYITVKNINKSKEEVVNELMEYAKANLPEHSIPAKIIVIDKMPFTQNGKIDYVKLEKNAMDYYDRK